MVVIYGWLAGLACLGQPPEAGPSGPTRPGVVFVIGGVGGIDLLGWSACQALPRAGVLHEVRNVVWTHGRGRILKDLQDREHLLAMAGWLAGEVRRLQAAEPGRPVYFLARSGGAGVALAAAETLPPDTLERIVLLSAAMSPAHDLRPALRATRGGIVSCYSPHDRLILGWGTSRFGTADRVYGPAAGLCGFVPPTDLDADGRRLYARLVQVPWQPWMLRYGFGGAHVGDSLPAFVGHVITPWLAP